MTTVTINQRITAWLAKMGYDVGGKPDDVVITLFSSEAAKWEISPQQLAKLINEDADLLHDVEPAC